jgi:cytoskeletal protein RodZ
MKHLLSGTALAAALAIAAPVWAQTPTTPNPAGTPSTTAPAPYTQSAPSTTMQTAPSATSQTAAPSAQQAPAQPTSPSASAPASSSTTAAATEPKAKRHVVRHASHMRSMHRVRHAPLARRGSRAPSDNIAAQLNRQELGRLSGSSMPAATQGYSQPGQPPSSSGR